MTKQFYVAGLYTDHGFPVGVKFIAPMHDHRKQMRGHTFNASIVWVYFLVPESFDVMRLGRSTSHQLLRLLAKYKALPYYTE